MKERQFQQWIIKRAIECGWLVYHTPPVPAHTTRTRNKYFTPVQGHKGFPDLVLCHRTTGRIIFAELKTDKGHIKPHQKVWHAALKQNPHIEFYLWRPQAMEQIDAILAEGLDTDTPPSGTISSL